MSTAKKTNAPKHLSAAMRRWWTAVVNRWVLEEHHIRLLTLAAESWDRKEAARQQIQREGLTVQTRDGGAKLHPAVRVEADCRVAFARLLRELDLDLEPPVETSRQPSLRSIG